MLLEEADRIEFPVSLIAKPVVLASTILYDTLFEYVYGIHMHRYVCVYIHKIMFQLVNMVLKPYCHLYH